MPIYDVDLSHTKASNIRLDQNFTGISAACAWEATEKALQLAAERDQGWDGATRENTVAAVTARN